MGCANPGGFLPIKNPLPAEAEGGVNYYGRITRGKRQQKQPTIRPTEYRCFIKEVNPLWRSGCENPIVEKFLRPPGNSPSRWHLTRGFLLCSSILYII